MMPSELPQFIVPERLAKEGACIEGRLELDRMTRLKELLLNSRGTVGLSLVFSRSASGITCITGNYDADLQLVCQRCLDSVTVNLSHKIGVGITSAGVTLADLPASLEPLTLTGEAVSLADFVEEEILLGLPISPMHEGQGCVAEKPLTVHRNDASNPFRVLEKLRIG